ncbi:MAG TPA: ZIP family metal transporter [Caulobacteraceae bacterium]|nr:ZIP family metal transporter [Caulobacteraceae bacterium]
MSHASSPIVVLLIGLATGAATLVGGAVALRFRSALDLFLGFSSGAVIGVALLDLLPEALDIGGGAHFRSLTIATAVAVGFALYLAADRAALVLSEGAEGHRGHMGPASLTAHSLMDGLGIGFAFQVSTAAGVIVAVAVLAHDFLDGANTVTLSLAGGAATPTARRWLVADALAPLVGIGAARLVAVPASVLALLLAVFAGFFLYIGASELLPRSHDRRPRLSTAAATAIGLGFIYAVVRLASL